MCFFRERKWFVSHSHLSQAVFSRVLWNSSVSGNTWTHVWVVSSSVLDCAAVPSRSLGDIGDGSISSGQTPPPLGSLPGCPLVARCFSSVLWGPLHCEDQLSVSTYLPGCSWRADVIVPWRPQGPAWAWLIVPRPWMMSKQGVFGSLLGQWRPPCPVPWMMVTLLSRLFAFLRCCPLCRLSGSQWCVAVGFSPSGTYGITVALTGTEISRNIQIYNISFCLY